MFLKQPKEVGLCHWARACFTANHQVFDLDFLHDSATGAVRYFLDIIVALVLALSRVIRFYIPIVSKDFRRDRPVDDRRSCDGGVELGAVGTYTSRCSLGTVEIDD